MKNKNYFIISLLVGLVLIIAAFYYIWQNFQEISIENFNDCADAGFPIMESYPRQCNANGMNFVEDIDWREDGISMMREPDTLEESCFGCGMAMCIDPGPMMIFVAESEERHCNYNFEIVANNLIQKCPDEWIDNQMPPVEPGEETEYFIIDGDRREISDFDMHWIETNCDIEKQVVY